jgi:integrase
MARRAEGWRLRPNNRTGIQEVRFTHQRRRFEISTGRRDPTEAAEEAKRIYAAVVSGRYNPDLKASAQLAPPKPGQPLDEQAALWLADATADHDEKTIETYGGYVRAHWQPFFGSLDRMVSSRIADYTRERLRKVIRRTVLKELSAMRGFLAWCFEHNLIVEIPDVVSPPSNSTGTPDKENTHKAGPIEVTVKEAKRFIAALPEWSLGKWGKRRFRVRAPLEFSYETGLRAETLRCLVGADFIDGSKLRIRREADKARWDRTLPLSKRAQEILRGIGARDLEPFFGDHDYRLYIDAACKTAKIQRISPHDLRHACGSHLVDATADIRGAAYLLGHKEITTMNKYARPTERAAERALKEAAKRARRR